MKRVDFQSPKKYLTQHWKLILVLAIASTFDAITTTIALSNPSTKEANPIIGTLIYQSSTTVSTLTPLALGLLVPVLIFYLWDRGRRTERSITNFKFTALLQILAGSNNTMIYLGINSLPLLTTTIFLLGNIYWVKTKNYIDSEKNKRKKIEKLPKPVAPETNLQQ